MLVEMQICLVLFMFNKRHAGITFKYSKMSFFKINHNPYCSSLNCSLTGVDITKNSVIFISLSSLFFFSTFSFFPPLFGEAVIAVFLFFVTIMKKVLVQVG